MNKVVLSGRLTRDPEVRYTGSENQLCIARYSLAVDDHRHKDADGVYDTDFPRIVAFGRNGEFAEKYFHKGMKVEIVGRIKTGDYTREDGTKVYTTEVYADEQEFGESKAESDRHRQADTSQNAGVTDGFKNDSYVTDDIDEGLPFV